MILFPFRGMAATGILLMQGPNNNPAADRA
jgi:hypothetical protein